MQIDKSHVLKFLPGSYKFLYMSNKERQQKRFERDRKRRLEKRLQKEKDLCSYEKFASIDELIRCFYKCKKGVGWKLSVQNYEISLFQNLSESHKKLELCINVSKGYVSYVGNPKLMNNVMADIDIKIPNNEIEREKISELFKQIDNLITLHQQIIN